MKNYSYIIKTLFTAIILLTGIALQSQDVGVEVLYPKADPFLKYTVAREPMAFDPANAQKNNSDPIRVVVKSRDINFSSLIDELGGQIHSHVGEYYTVQLAKSQMPALANFPNVEKLYLGQPMRVANDAAIKNVNADKVHQGIDLPRGYTGKDVVVGIIDTGIDFKHDDFRDPEDPQKSRIAYLWDQRNRSGAGQSPQNYFYGREWSRSDIEKELTQDAANIIAHLDTQMYAEGHGTHVAGTAAGNLGLAPEADLIVVSSTLTTSDIIDAANYIWQKAQLLGKPCVINMSFGSTFNPHDGTSVLSTVLNDMLEGTQGFVICAAAGNEGNDRSHWGGFELDEEAPISMYGTGVNNLAIYFRIPKEEGKDISFAVEVDSADFIVENGNQLFPFKTIGKTNWISLSQLLEQKSGQPRSVEFYHQDRQKACDIYLSAEEQDNYYAASIIIDDGISSIYSWEQELDKVDLFKIKVKGKGKFNAWISAFIPWIFDENNLRQSDIPTDGFVIPDNRFGVTAPADAQNIISVGAYTNIDSWTNFDRQVFRTGQEVGTLGSLSSLGPTIDGRVKPDISAPGVGVISAFPNQINIAASKTLPESILVDTDPQRVVFSGTSMSAPVVTGAVALLLEHNPFMSYEEIKELLISSALIDEHVTQVGPVPNAGFGFGKLDVYSALQATIALTNTQELDPNDDLFRFSVFPNPAAGQLNLRYTLPNSGNLRVSICNAVGQPLYATNDFFPKGNHTVPVDISTWSDGWYVAQITDGRVTATKVFMKSSR